MRLSDAHFLTDFIETHLLYTNYNFLQQIDIIHSIAMHCHCCQLVSSQTVYLRSLADICLAARSEVEVRARLG